MKVLFDLSSVMWASLLAGKDREALVVEYEGEKIEVNTCAYGYENSVNLITAALRDLDATPIDCIFVIEGMNSKARRLMIDPKYKSKRGKRPPEAYHEFNLLKEKLMEVFRGLGSIFVTQDNAEADDTIAYFAKHTEEDLVIVSNDNDLLALVGRNDHGARVDCRINGLINVNKYGAFDFKYITIYKALVGDTSDSISGIPGFGAKAWVTLHATFGDAGLAEIDRMGRIGSLAELELEAEQNGLVKRLYEGREDFVRSYQLASMHPEWVNGINDPLQWFPGMVLSVCTDERLHQYRAQTRLVGKANYTKALQFLQSKLQETPFFSVDLETSVPEQSDDWLAAADREKGVDVIASTITGASIVFGRNLQYAYYITVDHLESDNLSLEELNWLLSSIPKEKLTVAHNAAGFELPVLYNHFGEVNKDNGWRGFFPNMVDTRIAASYWDENQFSHGLKQLTKLLFNYEQETYDQVTGGKKMNQIPATQVTHYGCDDVYTSAALWNFFKLFMQLEHTYDAFMRIEQKPMYLQALSFVRGVRLDMARLSELSALDNIKEAENQNKIDSFLISLGWDGSVCPEFTELTPANVKQAVQIVLGQELECRARLLPKMADAIEQIEGGAMLAGLVREADLAGVNKLMASKFTAKPEFNPGSPKQLQDLLYTKMGIPIRLRNKPTETMRKAGVREGTPKSDDDAINLAIKLGDVSDATAKEFLHALLDTKSIHTRRSLYWDAYPKLLHWKTGRLHPELRQSATNTRRFAGSNPNIQQLDSSPNGVRSTILPHHKNAIILSLDESAQEVRQLADYCQDPDLLSCYVGTKEQLRDVHSLVGCKIAGCSYEEFRANLESEDKVVEALYNAIRKRAKITLFATLYGAAAPKIAQGLGITEQEAQEYIDSIYENFPQVKAWREASEAIARETGNVPIHGGTIRHLAPLVMSADTYVASKAMRQAGNARIQSAGGNQIKTVMGDIWDSRLIDDYDYWFYFSVHDETVHSVAIEHVPAVVPILHGFMTKQFLNTVPSASSIGLGKNFGQLIEIGEVCDMDKLMAALEKLNADATRMQ